MIPDAAIDMRRLNDTMRRKGFGDPKTTRYLTGQLFAAFGILISQ